MKKFLTLLNKIMTTENILTLKPNLDYLGGNRDQESNTKQVIFIRHGESDLNTARNRAKKISTNIKLPKFLENVTKWDELEDNIGLTRNGKSQATALVKKLECLWQRIL